MCSPVQLRTHFPDTHHACPLTAVPPERGQGTKVVSSGSAPRTSIYIDMGSALQERSSTLITVSDQATRTTWQPIAELSAYHKSSVARPYRQRPRGPPPVLCPASPLAISTSIDEPHRRYRLCYEFMTTGRTSISICY